VSTRVEQIERRERGGLGGAGRDREKVKERDSTVND